MTTKDEALKLALEALESFAPHNGVFWRNLHKKDAEIAEVITAIKEALAQPEPPPECVTEAEKKAFAFGWWKAMEAQRLAQPPEERNFCPRCGKRRRGKNDWDVHTCSLPEE